jgi:hypothetical protein
MKLNDLMIDEGAESEGVWVTLVGEFSAHLRSMESKEFKALHKKLYKPHENTLRQGRTLPEETTTKILNQLLAEAIILDWKGLEDEAGKPIKFTPQQAMKCLEAARELRELIVGACTDRANYRAKAKAEAAKN